MDGYWFARHVTQEALRLHAKSTEVVRATRPLTWEVRTALGESSSFLHG